jgi:hypothetical protein
MNWRGTEDIPEFNRLLASELKIVEAALPLTVNDSRQGFHIEGHIYMFNDELLQKKLKEGQELLKSNK